jgi:hypothetical protein
LHFSFGGATMALVACGGKTSGEEISLEIACFVEYDKGPDITVWHFIFIINYGGNKF